MACSWLLLKVARGRYEQNCTASPFVGVALPGPIERMSRQTIIKASFFTLNGARHMCQSTSNYLGELTCIAARPTVQYRALVRRDP
jgi:hypothetical protein